MGKEVTILIAEDDAGHARLIKKNLTRAGLSIPMIHFIDGQEVLDFLFFKGDGPHRDPEVPYLLLLDIRMPRVDGISTLAKIKNDPELRKMPVFMLTTSDNPAEITRCYLLGCSHYIKKPIEYETFANSIRCLGMYLDILRVPALE